MTSDGGYVGRFSRDGASLYFTKFDSPGLYRLDLKSGAETRVEKTEPLADSVAWALDGSAVWFLGTESGELRLYRLELSTGALSNLRMVDADPGGGLALDSAGRRLLFTRVVRSESDLVFARLP